jgi:hypothetical protein
MNVTLKSSQRSFFFTVRSGKIGCFVYAINDQQLVGQPSMLAEIDGSGQFVFIIFHCNKMALRFQIFKAGIF